MCPPAASQAARALALVPGPVAVSAHAHAHVHCLRCLLGFSTAARHEVYSHSTQNLAQNLLTCPPPDKNRRRSKTWRLG
jgi:hypothetical protein